MKPNIEKQDQEPLQLQYLDKNMKNKEIQGILNFQKFLKKQKYFETMAKESELPDKTIKSSEIFQVLKLKKKSNLKITQVK